MYIAFIVLFVYSCLVGKVIRAESLQCQEKNNDCLTNAWRNETSYITEGEPILYTVEEENYKGMIYVGKVDQHGYRLGYDVDNGT